MDMNLVRKLGQASVVTEWGRNAHTFVRYGIGAANDVDGHSQTADVLMTLDAAASAGVAVLIEVGQGVDTLAKARAGIPNPKTGIVENATEMWAWMQGNISLVKSHPAVAAYYGCDDCCHMGVIQE